LEMEQMQEFIGIIKSMEFKDRVTALGGYGFENTGQIIWIE